MFDSIYIDDLLLEGVRKVVGMGSPAPRGDRTLKAARHGAIDRTLFYEGRVLSLEGIIAEATELAAWNKLDTLEGKFALGAARTFKFRRTGRPDDEQCAVTVASPLDAVVSYEEPKIIRWGVELFAADPRIYGATLRSGSYDPAASTAGGGALIPLVFPLVFTTSTATHLELSNGGNFATPPVLTIKGPVTNPIIDNDTLGKSIFITYSLGSSDTVEIDVAERTVKLNGAERLDLLNAQDTTWWELAAGTNRLRLRGTGMELTKTLLTCQYRDARI